MIRPGQKVVCVDARWPISSPSPLKRGRVYVVAGVGDYTLTGRGPSGAPVHGYEVTLIGVENTDNPFISGFWSGRFRPLDETRLDIFRQMLVSPPKVEELSPVAFSDQEPS